MATNPSSTLVSVRRATIADKEGVLGINTNVYSGLDYLPFYYEKFIQCSYSKCYVSLIEDKVVGFCIATVVDGGQTVLTRAARVRPELAGQGIYKTLTDHIKKSVSVETLAFVTDETNAAIDTNSFLRVHRKILERYLHSFCFKLHDGNRHIYTEDNHRLKNADEAILKRLLARKAVMEYLSPSGKIMNTWVPFKTMAENIPLLYWHGNTMYTDVTDDAGNNVSGLLTSMTAYPAKADLICCHFDIYGSDLSSLKRHLVAHIQKLKKKYNGPVFMYVSSDPWIDMGSVKREVENLLHRFCILINEEKESMETSTRQIVFEKPL